MDSCSYKHYDEHGVDSRQFLEQYLSDKPDMVFEEDALKFPIENLVKTFRDGHIKGDILIDLSFGSLVHHLYAPCEFFQHIIVLKVSDRCILEMKRWLDSRTGAFNWDHTLKLHLDLEGKRGQLQDKVEKVRSSIPLVLKCDVKKENMTDPIVLPPADCLISFWLLESICKDEDDYIRYLRKFSQLLKPGGRLILFGGLNVSYYICGKDKIKVFSYDEAFLRKALVGEGFVIDDWKVKNRSAVSDLVDYKAVIFIAAHKEK